jgi:hypothetical protein
MKRKLDCYCGASFEDEFPEQVDLDAHDDLLDSILAGDFMTVDCPECGKHLKPEFPVRIISSRTMKMDLFLVPELDRGGLERGDLDYPLPPAQRVVVGYPELVEKIRIHRAGLDDRAIEVIKYHLLSRAMEGEEMGDRDPSVVFQGVEDDRLVFHIQGMKDGKIAVSRIPKETYLKVQPRLDELAGEEPFSDFLTPPHVSVSHLTGGRF